MGSRVHRGRASRAAVMLAVLCAAALLSACNPPPPAGSSSDPRLDSIDPWLTDPALPSEPGVQFSIRPSTAARDRLVVLFNGTGGTPASVARVGRSLAAQGFHVIGLRYTSELGTLDACPNSIALLDPECHRRFRSEVVFGAGVPAAPGGQGHDHVGVWVTPTTSVLNRLLAHVEYLSVMRQGEGWDRFLRLDGAGNCSEVRAPYGRCDLAWSRVVAMGYSQGAGVALYLASQVALDRVAMLAGPFDAFGSGTSYVPAPWLTEPFATPPSRMAVLVHAQDSHANRQRAAVMAVGLGDVEVDVTQLPAPYFGSRRLVSTARPDCPFPSADWAHSAPAGGGCTKDGLHAPAWAYLAGGA